MTKVLLDTNVFVAAILSRDGAPARLLDAWREGAFEVVTSPRLIDELQRTLADPKFKRYLTPEDIDEFLEVVKGNVIMVADRDSSKVRTRDPDDAFILALAPEVDLIVSGDKDFLAADVSVPIITPRAFLDAL